MLTATHTSDKHVVTQRPLTLRCYVYQEKSGLYVAECVDLNLIVKARKENKAKKELTDAIMGYVKVADEAGELENLIPRPSPLSRRLRYRAMKMAARVSLFHGKLFDCAAPVPTHCYA